MSTMSIATLEILEQSEMPVAYARAIAKAIETDFSRRLDALPTKSELQAAITGIRSEMLGMKSELRAEMHETKSELKLEIAGLRVEMRDLRGDVVRWVFVAVIGQTTLLSGIMYFLLQLVTDA